MDPSKNPIPSIPASQNDLKTYFLKLNNEVDSINGSHLLGSESSRLKKPKWSGRQKKGKKYKKFKRRLHIWEELNRAILHYIRGTALINGHPLKSELGRTKSGVDAFDLIRKTLDPVKHNEMSSSQDALDMYNILKLTSISKGAFEKFKIVLEERIEDMAANNMAMATDEKTLKLSLFNKLPHDAYKHIFLSMDKFETMSYKETIEEVARQAALIETAESKSTKNERRQVNNVQSNEDDDNVIPGTIGGFKVNRNGRINSEAWSRLTPEEKKSYYDAKDKLRQAGVVFPGDERNHGNSNTATKEQQQTIKELEKQLRESNVEKDSASPSSAAKLNKMTFAEVLKCMPEETATKTLNYVTSKLHKPG